MPLSPGIYPASVTAFDAKGHIDPASVAKLLAWFEAAGCEGVVLGGTNGEGPSLSAVEKRDLLSLAMPHRGALKILLGIATASLEEALWLVKGAAQSQADGILLMPPGYFRSASEQGIRDWFFAVLDRSMVPIILYNFPQMTGITLSPSLLQELCGHPMAAGLKDSSGEQKNIAEFRAAVPEGKLLFMGDEKLLLRALEAGWSGSISGAANILPHWLSQIVAEHREGRWESAAAKHVLLMPVLEALRSAKQPATYKALVHAFGVIDSPSMRLPLETCDAESILMLLQERLGMRPDAPGV